MSVRNLQEQLADQRIVEKLNVMFVLHGIKK
jgi:hypothetical protein